MGVRLLDDALIDQIAAGEVVERPASVVKELVENSLDAQAHMLRIRLDDGGRSLIRITDDGEGMDEHDAVLCLERHATSKIRTLDDLVHVRSLGFRGEAIPSIASVSRFELLTRRHDSSEAVRVTVEGGVLRGVAKAGAAPGTRITVRSLFYNVPVRRAFLRTAPTELGHCLDAVQRQILVRPDVDVIVSHNGSEVLRAPSAPDLRSRARSLLGKVAEDLREVDFEDRGVHVEGLMSPAGVHQGSGRGVHLYVNGRHVRDPVVRRALREAYQGIVPRGRHPVVILRLTVPDERVDVNVHPSKTEVRFHSPRDVVEVVRGGLTEALRRHGIQRRIADDAFGSRTRRPDPGALPLPLSAHPDDDPTFRERQPPQEPALPPWLAADVRGTGEGIGQGRVQAGGGAQELASAQAVPGGVTVPGAGPQQTVPGAGVGPVAPDGVGEVDDALRVEPLALLDGRVLLARRGQSVLLVDGGELRARLARRTLDAGGDPQRLLVPRRVEPGRALAARILAWGRVLDGVGVSVGAFDPGVLVIKRVPEPLLDADWEALLPELARRLAASGPEEEGAGLPEAARDALADGDTRPWESAEEALAALLAAELPWEAPLARLADPQTLVSMIERG